MDFTHFLRLRDLYKLYYCVNLYSYHSCLLEHVFLLPSFESRCALESATKIPFIVLKPWVRDFTVLVMGYAWIATGSAECLFSRIG